MNAHYTRKRAVWTAWMACGIAACSWAVTPAELQELLASGEPVAIIDIRAQSQYHAGHVPNAINVPERVLALKKLPPLGRVVVYGSGLGAENPAAAVRELNNKEGIQAEALEGGYAAWESARGTTTQSIGFSVEKPTYITYQDLEKLDAADTVLVDLRKPPAPEDGRLTRQGDPAAPEPLTPLGKTFPGRPVVASPFEISAVASRTGGAGGNLARMSEPPPVPLMVLIDNGDGEAEKTARMLKANGIHRVVILAGGEHILKRGGAPGLQRMGMGTQTVEVEDE